MSPLYYALCGCGKPSFISGRSTIDNILSLQETIHSFKQLHGKKGYMIIKLDLEKAYDRLEWTFVLETLNLLGLPPELIQVISHCLAPTSLRINWNGSCCSTITSTRGLRQGDLLSLSLSLCPLLGTIGAQDY